MTDSGSHVYRDGVHSVFTLHDEVLLVSNTIINVYIDVYTQGITQSAEKGSNVLLDEPSCTTTKIILDITRKITSM